MKIAIVGSAGRKSDTQHVSRPLYEAMIYDAKATVQQIAMDERIDLVSGGAAFADHVAVSLFLMGVANSLTLYLPAPWRTDLDFPKYDEKAREGSLSNYYHRQFSLALTRGKSFSATREGIQKAVTKGAVLNTDHLGYYKRNLQVGKVDALICYHFGGDGTAPRKPSGSRHCWDNSNATIKLYRPLEELMSKTS